MPVAVAGTAVAFVAAAVLAARAVLDAPLVETVRLGSVVPTGSVPIRLALHIDGFAALVVAGRCLRRTACRSTRRLPAGDPRYPSYAALVSLFTSAMLLVVYSGDLMVLLVGWEVMGICSYFLVGHYWEPEAARAAALKAFLVTKLGDVPFLFGIFALGVDAGTFDIERSAASRPVHPHGDRRDPAAALRRRRASRRSSRCTPGCPTRWRAPPRSPR